MTMLDNIIYYFNSSFTATYPCLICSLKVILLKLAPSDVGENLPDVGLNLGDKLKQR